MAKPKVKLIAYTPLPEKVVAAAAKLCYSQVGVDEITEGLTEEKTENFLKMLNSIGHNSPTEHASFTFAIEGVSRSLLAQITRHRIASFSVQSQRYVRYDENNTEYVVPPVIEEDEAMNDLYAEFIDEEFEGYRKFTQKLEELHISRGIDPKKANKMANEDARFLLPNACTTKMVMTMNTRSMLNFFKHRCCNRAQWEIREVANQMLDLVLEVAPTLFAKAGAPYAYDKCPEGKMSCGQKQKPRVLQLVPKLDIYNSLDTDKLY